MKQSCVKNSKNTTKIMHNILTQNNACAIKVDKLLKTKNTNEKRKQTPKARTFLKDQLYRRFDNDLATLYNLHTLASVAVTLSKGVGLILPCMHRARFCRYHVLILLQSERSVA